jgi:SAM-dependent methyltransferase
MKEVKNWYSDPKNWVNPGPNAHDFDKTLIPLSIIEGKRVLNLGCFYPRIEQDLSYYADYWVSIDFCDKVIDRCETQFPTLPVHFRWMDMKYVSHFGIYSFDTILDLSSGDHMTWGDYSEVIDSIHRGMVLTANGHFVVTYANWDHFEDGQCELYGDWGYERRTPSGVMRVLLEQYFKILKEDNTGKRSGFLCQKL